ncbi:MAG: helix-turn-helix domain-containing protein [Myxococcaceae bacterium]
MTAKRPRLDPRELLLTIAEAATLLRCPRRTISALLRAGRLQRGPKTGQERTVTRASVEAYATSEPDGPPPRTAKPQLDPREYLYTMREAAELLRCSRETIFELRRKRKLQGARRLGRECTVTRRSLEAFVHSELLDWRRPRRRKAREEFDKFAVDNDRRPWTPIGLDDIKL